jgi:hypothetical protein
LPTSKHSTNKPFTKQANIKNLEEQITKKLHSTHACEMNKKTIKLVNETQYIHPKKMQIPN